MRLGPSLAPQTPPQADGPARPGTGVQSSVCLLRGQPQGLTRSGPWEPMESLDPQGPTSPMWLTHWAGRRRARAAWTGAGAGSGSCMHVHAHDVIMPWAFFGLAPATAAGVWWSCPQASSDPKCAPRDGEVHRESPCTPPPMKGLVASSPWCREGAYSRGSESTVERTVLLQVFNLFRTRK